MGLTWSVLLTSLLLLGVVLYLGNQLLDRQRALVKVQIELQQLTQALNEHAIVSATDVHGNILEVNEKFSTISGYRRDELLGQNHRLIKSQEHGLDFFKAMWRTIGHGKVWQGEIKNRKKNGGYYWTSATIVPFLNAKGKPEKYLSIRTDITAIKDSQQKIDHLAYYDPLTDLPNRRFFLEQLEREMKVAKRHKTVLALLFLDLDCFKEVNDTYGHDQGDLLLKQTAQRLSQCLRAVDMVSRLGGDEFTIILTDIHQASLIPSTQGICHGLIEALAQPFQLGLHEIRISVSIGIALYPADGENATTLIRNADRAMYRAKKRRSHHVFYASIDDPQQFEQRFVPHPDAQDNPHPDTQDDSQQQGVFSDPPINHYAISAAPPLTKRKTDSAIARAVVLRHPSEAAQWPAGK